MIYLIGKNSKREDLEKILASIGKAKIFCSNKYIGKLRLTEDSLLIQKKLIEEWNNRFKI